MSDSSSSADSSTNLRKRKASPTETSSFESFSDFGKSTINGTNGTSSTNQAKLSSSSPAGGLDSVAAAASAVVSLTGGSASLQSSATVSETTSSCNPCKRRTVSSSENQTCCSFDQSSVKVQIGILASSQIDTSSVPIQFGSFNPSATLPSSGPPLLLSSTVPANGSGSSSVSTTLSPSEPTNESSAATQQTTTASLFGRPLKLGSHIFGNCQAFGSSDPFGTSTFGTIRTLSLGSMFSRKAASFQSEEFSFPPPPASSSSLSYTIGWPSVQSSEDSFSTFVTQSSMLVNQEGPSWLASADEEYHSISAKFPYLNKSHEELRWEDYKQPNKERNSPTTSTSTCSTCGLSRDVSLQLTSSAIGSFPFATSQNSIPTFDRSNTICFAAPLIGFAQVLSAGLLFFPNNGVGFGQTNPCSITFPRSGHASNTVHSPHHL